MADNIITIHKDYKSRGIETDGTTSFYEIIPPPGAGKRIAITQLLAKGIRLSGSTTNRWRFLSGLALLNITSIAVSNPGQITIAGSLDALYPLGGTFSVHIRRTSVTAAVVGPRVGTYLSDTVFTVPVNVSSVSVGTGLALMSANMVVGGDIEGTTTLPYQTGNGEVPCIFLEENHGLYIEDTSATTGPLSVIGSVSWKEIDVEAA
jgi:hypothetical protein